MDKTISIKRVEFILYAGQNCKMILDIDGKFENTFIVRIIIFSL